MATVMELTSPVEKFRFGRIFEHVPGSRAEERLAPLDGFVISSVRVPGVKQR
jgi:hypothetical protein